MATVDIPFLLPRQQPTGIRVQAYAAGGQYSVFCPKARRVLFHTDELRLGDVTLHPNGRLAGILRQPMLATEFQRWSLVAVMHTEGGFFEQNSLPIRESIFAHLSPDGIFVAVPLHND
jgi:hypothetical protein